jgi:iron complex outermembrane recepter protein
MVAALASAPSHASAAAEAVSGDSVQLEEVIVSARKRDERLIDIPESISVISADDLLKKGIQSVEDVGRQTPNLQLNMRQDLTTNVVIRGIGAYGDVLGVGFSIDNVPNFTDQTMRLEDVESVEILKGPQGTLYGGSSIGGLVRYVSKRPEFNWEGETFMEVGNYSHIDVSAAQNIPIIDGKLALRVSAYSVKDDGYIPNPDLGINADPLTDYGMRAVFLYKPTDTLEALLTLRHSYIQNGGDMYLPVPAVNAYTYDAHFFQPTTSGRPMVRCWRSTTS